ncbi:hypothetical protein ACE38V_09090 [Cytobacillus sp. Hz8]|uniref:hypothetical protein n=1 Tax=Cytobacillus sp. Hz8 TaxID=3347168 RepID=UPI0035DF1F9C
MVEIKSVKIDGEEIHVFQSVIFIFASNTGYTLELDMIISEVVFNKYKKETELIIEIELKDGRVFAFIMQLKAWNSELPRLTLFCEIGTVDEYVNFPIITEEDSDFPKLKGGITLADIRKVEMPWENITLRLKLPIEQVEWLSQQKRADLNSLFNEMIEEYRKRSLK